MNYSEKEKLFYVDQKELTWLKQIKASNYNHNLEYQNTILDQIKLYNDFLNYPENKKFAAKCKKKSINFIQLISPTTPFDRMKKIIKDSHDMVYYISMLSTTGGKLKVSPKKFFKAIMQ